jgi:nitrite reductase/ring-hydroxylating ferredoxin subunit
MTDRHHVASRDELSADESRLIATVDGQEVAVFNEGGEYYAVANWCPHEGGPLCEGDMKGETGLADDGWELTYGEEVCIQCPWHAWSFDIRTGEHIGDDRYRVPTYDVVVEDNDVFVVR